jgi:hypothetical protein
MSELTITPLGGIALFVLMVFGAIDLYIILSEIHHGIPEDNREDLDYGEEVQSPSGD